jgi:hypothetical protein
MKKIFNAIGRALKKALSIGLQALRFGAVATLAPVGAVADAMFGRSQVANDLPEPGSGVEVDYEVADPDSIATEHQPQELLHSHSIHHVHPAAPAYEYVCLPRDKRRIFDLSGLPSTVQSWCRRLTEAECQLVRKAGCRNMLQHLSGKRVIPGVSLVTQHMRSYFDEEHDVRIEGSESQIAMNMFRQAPVF